MSVLEGKPFFDRRRLAFLGVLLLGFLIYIPCLKGLPVWDDKPILQGAAIGGGTSLLDCFTHPFLFHYYRPFTSASYCLDRILFGQSPMLFHQTNILFHLAGIALVVWLTEALLKRPRLALFAGLLFAVQPAQVSTVAWIGGRTDSLGTVFALAMVLGLVRWNQGGRWPWLAMSVATYLLAMLTKEQTAALGLLAPITALALRPREERKRAATLGSIPFVAAGTIFVSLWCLNFPDPFHPGWFGIAEQASQLGRTNINYLLLFLVPNPWSMHTFSLENLSNPLLIGLGLVLFVGFFAGVWRLWKTDRRLSLIAIFALLAYLPISNVVPVPSFLAGPYRVGTVGPAVAILMALGIDALWRRRAKIPAVAMAVGGLAGVVLSPWGASKWTSEVELFGTFAQYDPGSVGLRMCNIYALETAHHYGEGLKETAKLLDDFVGPGQWEDYQALPAKVEADKTLQWRICTNDGVDRQPLEQVARLTLARGQLLASLGRDEEAIQALEATVKLDPQNDHAWFSLGKQFAGRDEARSVYCYKQALASNYQNAEAADMLGVHFRDRGDLKMAYLYLGRVPTVRCEFGQPLMDFADVAMRLGHYREAQHALDLAKTTLVDRSRLAAMEVRAERHA